MGMESHVTSQHLVDASNHILDCTLRDGGCAVKFKFSADTIRDVLTNLETCGIRLIELGHGLGLNAASALDMPSLVSDEDCCAIASETLRTAEWGMFCIPGVAAIKHLRSAARYGMHFVRVGVNITEVEDARPFVDAAREHGVFVFVNLMKTPVLDLPDIAAVTARCVEIGADAVYLVDSAGGLMPDETAKIVQAVKATVEIPIGFHGHDNFGFANANALAALDNGATLIDTTLDGIGRSAGNANTEALATIIEKRTGDLRYDGPRLAKVVDNHIRGLNGVKDGRYLQVVAAYTNLHSAFLPLFLDCANATDVDLFELMKRVATINRLNPDLDTIYQVAHTMAYCDSNSIVGNLHIGLAQARPAVLDSLRRNVPQGENFDPRIRQAALNNGK